MHIATNWKDRGGDKRGRERKYTQLTFLKIHNDHKTASIKNKIKGYVGITLMIAVPTTLGAYSIIFCYIIN